MLELKNDNLVFSFGNVHRDANIGINFQRTLRIPDDGKTYPLPPGKGNFPLRHVDDYKNKLPSKWTEHGGVFLPMYQSEALWINMNSAMSQRYPFAIKISTGKISAITGNEWKSGLSHKDYCVTPNQQWVDGYVVSNGSIRQFVASPMGSGVSVESQITGKDEFGGIQIEVFPMKAEEYKKRFNLNWSRILRGVSLDDHSSSMWPLMANGQFTTCSTNSTFMEQNVMANISETMNYNMSMAAGGMMKQQIIEDPYGIDVWDTTNSSRCFVHLTNSMVWRHITGSEPPTVPMTASEYSSRGLPWFDFYQESNAVNPSPRLQNVKSISNLKPEMLPENGGIKITSDKILTLSATPTPNKIREGSW